MSTKPVSQIDASGLFARVTFSHESPREPGVWLMPAGTVEALPPGEYVPTEAPGEVGAFTPAWPADQWPRWNGAAWELIAKPTAQVEPSPAEKLAAFLANNPDVAAMVAQQTNP